MSVILRRDGEIRLYTKGADNVIYDRLKSNQVDVKSRTQEHLNVSMNLDFLNLIVPLIFRLMDRPLRLLVWMS